MYAIVPFNAGTWSQSKLLDTIKSLFNGTTDPNSLPWGDKANATIVSTVAPGWTVVDTQSTYFVARAPARNRTDAYKFVKVIFNTTVSVTAQVGNGYNSPSITTNGVSTSFNLTINSLAESLAAASGGNILLHVSITPDRFCTFIEQRNNVGGYFSEHSCSGVVDVQCENALYHTANSTLLPIAVFNRVESANAVSTKYALASEINTVTAANGIATISNWVAGSAIQFSGIQTTNQDFELKNSGAIWTGSAASYDYLYEIGYVSGGSQSSDNGVVQNLYAISATKCSTKFTEYTANSKTYVAWPARTTTYMLMPKE